jgi:hypothetical protein
MMISIDAERAFNKIQHPFMIKVLNKLGIKGSTSPIGNIVVNHSFCSREGWRPGMNPGLGNNGVCTASP